MDDRIRKETATTAITVTSKVVVVLSFWRRSNKKIVPRVRPTSSLRELVTNFSYSVKGALHTTNEYKRIYLMIIIINNFFFILGMKRTDRTSFEIETNASFLQILIGTVECELVMFDEKTLT
ncbi:4471_t:CDS:2, partial [Cetraspora pellucida]